MDRVKFTSTSSRNKFFEMCWAMNEKCEWNTLSKRLGVCRKVLGQYRSGSLTLPKDLFNKLLGFLPIQNQKDFLENIVLLKANWGKVKGGKRAYLKNKKLFDKGREKAIKKSKEKIKVFDIFLPLTKEIVYFVGFFIGDGFTNKYQRTYLTQFTGQYGYEFNFYKDYLSKIGKKHFGLIPRIRKDKNSDTVRATYSSKYLYDFFVKRLKISAGRKSHTVLIPEEIVNSPGRGVLDCIAGLYDAEGSFYFVEKEGYKKPYPVLEFHVNNPSLVKQISTIFKEANIKHSSWKNKRIVHYGEESIKNLLEKIKIRDPKLLRKIPQHYF